MKVINMGNIAEAYTCDDLPAMGIVIEATLDELERLPNLVYKEVAISAMPRRNCDRFATVDEARKAHEEYCVDYIVRASNIFDFPMKFEAWLFAPATEKEGGAK